MKPEIFYTHEILNKLEIMQSVTIIDICDWGSHLYGTNTKRSDHDIVAIFDTDKEIYDIIQTKDYPNLFNYEYDKDLHIISKTTFQRLLNEHDIMAMEIYFNKHNWVDNFFTFNLNLDTLRRKISSVCSNSWSKARKKLDIPEEDDYIGLKSLFHSIRILSFGIDIARDGNIDFKNVLINTDTGEKISCLNLWNRILQKYESGWRWAEFKKKYTPLQNSNATFFRTLAPKEL